MPTPWLRKIRDNGKLTVYNAGDEWKVSVDKAITTFNTLGFPVTLAAESNIEVANIVVKLAKGADKHQFKSRYYSDPTVKTRARFNPAFPHGDTVLLVDPDRNEVAFAATFLPGKLDGPSDGLKEALVVHELIHGCGLDGGRGPGKPNDRGQDHDSVGIMYDLMRETPNGIVEGNVRDNNKSMPPIRVGGKTRSNIVSIWKK